MVLTNNPLAQNIAQMKDGIDFIGNHPACRNACPVRNNGSNCLRVYLWQNERMLALELRQLFQFLIELFLNWRCIGIFIAIGLAEHFTQLQNVPNERLLFDPLSFQTFAFFLKFGQFLFNVRELLSHIKTGLRLAFQNVSLSLHHHLPLPAIIHCCRCGVLRKGNAGTGRINQTDCFVGQLSSRNKAHGKMNCSFQCFIKDLHLMVLFKHGCHTAHNGNGFIRIWLFNQNVLEPAGKSRIFLNMLLVF